ncbi:YggS family pyridoxal phosphate-dependent enzyme [Leifsonia sp. YIM 134122]|uniref:Pyridoxal phosphate homeostasis protein n=2 Tax=Microbacteriaceae TaxID=85023 RepID=A0A4Y9R3J0_9MICO|nr:MULTISPECIES: YggS family pyridoxal phosphate-dependent enzyme [Leifsonia]KQQ95493.1 alanine racemase [Leifsonia sp. Leaf325]TFV98880.1 YggS family pyridoxal phosphate-dependent enzyme [Leifsonia flava]
MTDATLAERLGSLRLAVSDAAAEAGRSVDDITTIAVTKFHPAALIRDLVELGVHDIAENRHQEARDKAAELSGLPIRWHFVGQVQGKKARQVRAYADVIHSVDRSSLVDALASEESSIDCFVQVNLTADESRGGATPARLPGLVDEVLAAPGLRLLGLMAVAPLDEDPRRAFAHVRALSERIQRQAPHATSLSMGMSQDFRAAILEGATHLRIGTIITGNRPDPRLI